MDDVISAKNDVVFKVLFSRNKELLREFLNDVLDISIESVDDIDVLNPELPPESIDGKFSRLDINVRNSEENVNIEMQVAKETDFKERILFYWSKMYADDLEKGQPYSELKKSYSISILDFNMFDCDSYYSSFSIRKDSRNERFSDKLSLHIFELKKLESQIDPNNRRALWMQFIKADSKEEFDMLMNTDNQVIKSGVQTIYELNKDEKLREYIRQREKTIRDYDSSMANAMARGRAEGEAKGLAKGREEERNRLSENLRKMGMTEEQIKNILNS
ncbi:MAG: Rpn family recombination-promoting nuclease/putative transposase [Clostridium sp.]|nr:Rpn family recombination-promoting nuclease/putative transposase [Clostridium sp.]MCM1547104.1 Rpn family recombination-promoting nuclease/putative transposase [Ruminococcus sp.]